MDPEARAPNGLTFGQMIQRELITKFSFAWATKSGVIIFPSRDEDDDDEFEDDDDVAFAVKIGLDHAPRIRIDALTAVELSLVSVPADPGAGFSQANFQRSLVNVINKRNYTPGEGGILVPEGYEGKRNCEKNKDGETVCTVKDAYRKAELEDEDELREIIREEIRDYFDTEFEIVIGEKDIKDIIYREENIVMNRGVTPFTETETIDRPWSKDDALQRVEDFILDETGDDELDLEKEEHRELWGFAHLGWRDDGTTKGSWFGPHHDRSGGEWVSNRNAVANLSARFDQIDFDSESDKDKARTHLNKERELHGFDEDDED